MLLFVWFFFNVANWLAFKQVENLKKHSVKFEVSFIPQEGDRPSSLKAMLSGTHFPVPYEIRAIKGK